jgi:hypothetical protein
VPYHFIETGLGSAPRAGGLGKALIVSCVSGLRRYTNCYEYMDTACRTVEEESSSTQSSVDDLKLAANQPSPKCSI